MLEASAGIEEGFHHSTMQWRNHTHQNGGIDLVGLEKKLEKRCTDVAKAHGWYTRKWASPSSRGVPDRIFIKDGNIAFIEFKAPGNTPTKLQAHEINLIKQHGGNAFYCDNIDNFKARLGILT
jgi:hypothetical protein